MWLQKPIEPKSAPSFIPVRPQFGAWLARAAVAVVEAAKQVAEKVGNGWGDLYPMYTVTSLE